jgi:hypothetical protein
VNLAYRTRHWKTRKNADPEQWERALKKAIERAGAEERPKILDLDF